MRIKLLLSIIGLALLAGPLQMIPCTMQGKCCEPSEQATFAQPGNNCCSGTIKELDTSATTTFFKTTHSASFQKQAIMPASLVDLSVSFSRQIDRLPSVVPKTPPFLTHSTLLL
ncbi:MAG: hypothetical protein A2W61_07865 [Deltaproteobacteria bacterium RIFCSPLOWO2_01_44_7]|nr:MAG: hypothetical protein A2712_01395 [Deltaproteobacteria bacterium RIFCSPHIGHO2_01_FULL_43_49]OGQ15211.1 MAG: hypothetical protein A3D22_04080 [Deltaproteobacteria bacterium RIFCSPHIGHO2_02_FULL_44_53]OGQ27166.1 MAG: hypothetical protein A3D98_01985 [Deltaproteobacteria bacterium RIFCSPHIGHO2_12_FULL_44_21]OGQ31728.1 MAG: hypothetical protein A2979_05240 [Deltaproteobacteria bacterium RIFCSPLOWO2_01_FULL_45_74]OGQ41662.1 MAG: hypothetical protein A2W61_07865 [Deltaproteobacteria bacterium 